MAAPSAPDRVVAAARAGGVDIEVRTFPEGTKTSADAAAAIGCDVGAIVKSLVFLVDGRPVVGLLPGDLRLDTAKLAAAAGGERASRAPLDEVRAATGYVAGGTPPFGHDRALPVFADPNLRRYEGLWAAGGTPNTVFLIGIEDLMTLSGAVWADLAEAPRD